ncbi:MAG: hypothetical protein QNJ37_19725 [Crocosphaera sp.]|nr:hypothetical protein [Crocosphaera sp.]
MFANIPETKMHWIRWGLAIGWLLLIFSMFYDPVSAFLTEPYQFFGPKMAHTCYEFQGKCLPLSPYPLGPRIFWGMIVPTSIIILVLFGHEAWRRICPLSFFSQLPRALGWQRKRLVKENSWLSRNHLYLQWGLLFLGLNVRLLLVNSDRLLLGIFLSFTILSAITVGFLYGGKSWCHYFCPMAPVQMIYSEPSGILTSEAHTAPPMSITQSMCRKVDSQGQEKSACVACQSPCMDIDAENGYWSKINQSDRKLLYYGYLGLAIGFYVYFGLYSGNWQFLSGGVWNETNQLVTLFSPGFYISGHAIPIPKIVAVPLTLLFFSGATYVIGMRLEKAYKRYNKRFKKPLSLEQVHHRLFTLFTFVSFNCLFFLGVRPTLGWIPFHGQNMITWAAILMSGLWLVKAWQRRYEQYTKERDSHLLRRQLGKMSIDCSAFLEGRTLDDLNADELYALAKVLPGFTHQSRLQVYTGTLKEAIAQRRVSYQSSLKVFQSLRQELGINEDEHWRSLEQLCQDYPELFVPHLGQISDAELTIRRPIKETFSNPELTMQRPLDVKYGQSLSVLGKGNREQGTGNRKHLLKGSRDGEKTIQRPFSKKK